MNRKITRFERFKFMSVVASHRIALHSIGLDWFGLTWLLNLWCIDVEHLSSSLQDTKRKTNTLVSFFQRSMISKRVIFCKGHVNNKLQWTNIIKFPIQLTDLYILWHATSSVIKRGKQCDSIHEKKITKRINK